MCYDIIIMLIFAYLTLSLRSIPQEFSIQNELIVVQMILLCKIIFYTATFVLVVDGNQTNKAEAIDKDQLGNVLMNRSNYLYIESLFDFLVMFITGIVLLYKTTL